MKFSDLGLGPEILRAVEDAGYVEPTPIQQQAIPVVLMNRDVLGCAQTGTGKTASFVLPMIEILAAGRAKARMPRSLILEPTRELAAQVDANFAKYGKYHKLTTALLIGGTSFTDQERNLMRGVDVLIATPGRLIDLFERGKILMSDVKILVIDEADRMLDMGFIPDVERIVSLLPRIRQTLFFSATMAPEIRRLADKFLMNPKEITVAPPASPAAGVDHFLVVVPHNAKRDALCKLIENEDVKSALIFCNRKRDIGTLVHEMKRRHIPASEIHGDMPQSKRMETMDAFKRGEIRLLVASDVAARGLDISDLSHVFNFDVPHNPEDYVHRIGRTGRAGRSGRAFTLATPEDGKFVAGIEKLIGKPITPAEVPGMETAALDRSADSDSGRRRGGRSRGRRGGRSGARSEGRSEARSEGKSGGAQAPHGDSSRPKTGHGQHAPAATAAPAPAQAAHGKPHPASHKPARQGGHRDTRRPQPPNRRQERDDLENLPAFILRPLVIKGGKK